MTLKLSEIKNANNDLGFIESIISNSSKYFSRIFIALGFMGYEITLMSLAFGLFASYFALSGKILLGFCMFCVFIFLDHCDGQVARYRKEPSEAGQYMDSRVHFIVEPFFLLSLGIGSYSLISYSYLSSLFLVSGLLAGFFYLIRQTMKIGDLGDLNAANRGGSRTISKEKSLLGKINFWAFEIIRINNPFGILLWAILFNFLGYVLVFYAAIFGGNTAISFYKNYMYLRKNEEKMKEK